MKIVADTATLFTPEEGCALGVTIIPVCVAINGETYRDLVEMDSETFLKLIQEGGVPASSQPAIGDLIDIFENCQEDTIVLTVGDGLSGAYQNAVGAKNSMDNGEHIHIIDTKTLGGPFRYLVQKAVELREKGLGIEEVKKEILDCIESSVSFVIPFDFNFLKRSGRLTPLAAKIGAMIRIVPVLTQTEDKKRITPFAVKRSRKKAVDAIIEHLKCIGVNESYRISVAHAGVAETGKEVVAQVQKHFQNTSIELFTLSPALMTHGGPGCILIQAIKA